MNDEDLRDLFAGLAMQGIVSRGMPVSSIREHALNAYAVADAMIEARREKASRITDHDSGIMATKPARKAKKGVA
jgi:hypothetical protein